MKVAFVYGPMSLGARPLDFARLYDDPRGLTGSELSCIEYARHMARRGHEVTLFVCQPEAPSIVWSCDRNDRITYVELGSSKLARLGEADRWDAICVWNEPDILRGADPGAVRLVNQQLNDWTYCQPHFCEHVDVFTSPSAHHRDFVSAQIPCNQHRPHWEVLPNGCDPSLYTDGRRVPGRVLWASSPDRGLHLLLQAWPMIRERVPHATLHALYNFAPGGLINYEEGSIGLNGLPVTPDIQELARRYRYIQHAMVRLTGMGVSAIGSVSRKRVVEEMDQAVVLGYPCDTIRYTEGFSVTTMEACAAGLVPVITGEDALGSIYGEATFPYCMGTSSIPPHYLPPSAEDIAWNVAAALEDEMKDMPGGVLDRCRALAAAHAWPVLAERLESILLAEKDKKEKERGYRTEVRSAPTGPARVLQIPVHDRWKVLTSHPTGPGGFDYVICGAKNSQGFPCKEPEGHGGEHCTYRGPYEVDFEDDGSPPGSRVAEWYVNHHYYGHKTMRYWTTWDVMVGGTIYDKAEWEYLKRRYALTHIINVESEHSDEGKDDADKICEAGRQADDASPRRIESMLAVLDFAFGAHDTHPAAKFYVHCQMGASRSPAFAYLLLRGLHGMTREEALAEIHRTRPEYAGPVNPGHHLAYLKSADEAVERWRAKDDGGAPIGICLWGSGTAHEVAKAIEESAHPNNPPIVVGERRPGEHWCQLCGKACERWQVFCGAACCARWEAGERPERGAT